MYEVFNPAYGRPLLQTRRRWVARFLAWLWSYDYNLQGKGWA